MLEAFLISNRDAIITRTRASVAAKGSAAPSSDEMTNGIPAFLDQLGEALRVAKSSTVIDHARLASSAGRHGQDMLRMGLSVAQVVRDYGEVCQAITDLAVEQEARIPAEEFRTLNLCLDDATAEAVTAFALLRDRSIANEGVERLGVLAHEMRNLLNVAKLAFEGIKSGRVPVRGSTGAVLDRSLLGLGNLVDRSLADVRLDAGINHPERIRVAELVEEVEVGAFLEAQDRGLRFVVRPTQHELFVEGDRQSLAAAMANLLQNAFKFTKKCSQVSLTTLATTDRVLFEVEDEGGGLPPGAPEELFHAFEQRGKNRSGLGLGLAISLKAASASGGSLRARDLPLKGCVFTLDLPRR